MDEWGFKDAATAEAFLKTRRRKQRLAGSQRRKSILKVDKLAENP